MQRLALRKLMFPSALELAVNNMVAQKQQVTTSEIKAHKMSFKEKVVTKMFGKKIAKSVNAAAENRR
jgi:hypothetical protein